MTTAVKPSIVEGKSKRKRGLCLGWEEIREGQKGKMSSEWLGADQLIKLSREDPKLKRARKVRAGVFAV